MSKITVNGTPFSSQSLKQMWEHFVKGVIKSLDLIGMGCMHLATIPTLLAVNAGMLDKMPSVEIVLFIWAGLSVWFARALIENDRAMLAGIGIGFIVQAALMALVLFK